MILRARIDYIASRAAWKILSLTWDDGQSAALPTQRYFDMQRDITTCLQGLYLPSAVELVRRDPCREEHHSLLGAQLLAHSRSALHVFLRCACGQFRQVPLEEWEERQRKAS